VQLAFDQVGKHDDEHVSPGAFLRVHVYGPNFQMARLPVLWTRLPPRPD